jgi:sugar/nucleoside kinase (ribokinase family)
LVAGVSDSKAIRVVELPERLVIDAFSLNEGKLASIEPTVVNQLTKQQIADVCARTRAKFVMVTRGSSGYVVLSRDGVIHRFNALTTDRFISSTGAGDALLAGLAVYCFQERTFDWQRSYAIVARYVRRVLEEEGATVGSLAREIDFA